MSTPFTPTPDMLAILADVERNPRSKLLRLPIQLGNPGTFEEVLGGNETFLNSAERKLVRTYRGELEEYLYFRGQDLLASSTWGQSTLINREAGVAQAKSVDLSTDRGLRLNEVSDGTTHPSTLFSASNREALAFLQAAAQLIPRASTTVLMGLTCLKEGRVRPAITAFANVLHDPRSPKVRCHAANNLGLAYLQLGELEMAAKAFKWAVRLAPNWVEPRVSALICAASADRWPWVQSMEQELHTMHIEAGHDAVRKIVRTFLNGPGSKLVLTSLAQTKNTNPGTLATEILTPFE